MSDRLDETASGRPSHGALREYLPLRGLACVLIVLLSVLTAAIVSRIGLHELHWRDTISRWSESSPSYWLDHITNVVTVPVVILFLAWFRRARINAEHRGWHQRRARGWTFWGWILPVVNFWIPFQIMGDIWRAGLTAQDRSKIAWLPALWWTTWLLGGGTEVISRSSVTGAGRIIPSLSPGTWSASLIPLAVAGMTLMAIVCKVSKSPVGSPALRAPAGAHGRQTRPAASAADCPSGEVPIVVSSIDPPSQENE